MKARIPKHREFIINFPDSIDQNKANEGWAKLQQIVEWVHTSPSARRWSRKRCSAPPPQTPAECSGCNCFPQVAGQSAPLLNKKLIY